MKTIIKYVSNDGCEFDTEEECAKYESLCSQIYEIIKPWTPCDIDPNDGNVFVQQDKNIVLNVQRAMVRIFEREHWKDGHTDWALTANVPAGMTLIGRYAVDDVGFAPERRVWHRIQRLDRNFREWGQPYFAIRSDKHG